MGPISTAPYLVYGIIRDPEHLGYLTRGEVAALEAVDVLCLPVCELGLAMALPPTMRPVDILISGVVRR